MPRVESISKAQNAGVRIETKQHTVLIADGYTIASCYPSLVHEGFEVPLDGDSRPKGTGTTEPPAGAAERAQSIGGDVLALTSHRSGGRVRRKFVLARVMVLTLDLAFSSVCSIASSGIAFAYHANFTEETGAAKTSCADVPCMKR